MAEPQNKEVIHQNSGEPETVVFKGYKSGLTLLIPELGPFDQHLQELKLCLEQAQDFFKGARVNLQIGDRVLKDTERAALVRMIKEAGLFLQRPANQNQPPKTKEVTPDEPEYFVPTITVKKTVRSGQRVEFAGNLVIMGDVNPGAEVVASGDIIVLGKLRGTAHAGAKGDLSAQIIALQLKPVQLRIAGTIARAPEKDANAGSTVPEIAKIRDEQIVVERFNG